MANPLTVERIHLGAIDLVSGAADPTAGAGISAPIGSSYFRTNGSQYVKTGAGDTTWSLVAVGGASPSFANIVATGNITAATGVVEGQRLYANQAGSPAAPAVRIGSEGTGLCIESTSVSITRLGATTVSAAPVVQVNDITVTNSVIVGNIIDMAQVAEPAAPAAGRVRLWNADNGGGKSQYRARFDTGASQPIATEP